MIFRNIGDQMAKTVTKSQSRHQEILSPTSVTDIDKRDKIYLGPALIPFQEITIRFDLYF